MQDDDLNYLSACEAARRFRDRSLSPVELLDAQIARAEGIRETVNPFGDCYFDEARERATVDPAHAEINDDNFSASLRCGWAAEACLSPSNL